MEYKAFYQDDFFRSENGQVYTRMYLENEGLMKLGTYTPVENPCDELRGVSVCCCYSQIFYPDSTRLLCNNIPNADPEFWDGLEHGELENEYGDPIEIFQYILIDSGTAERLKEHTNELIFYSQLLDLYVLGVTHWGTSWDYVGADFIY